MKSTIISSYISRSLFGTVLASLFVIITISFISIIVDETNDIQIGYDFYQVLVYSLLKLPAQSVPHFPSAVLIGSLISLSLLSRNSEITVIRASGISRLQLFWYMLRPVFLFMLVGILISEYVAPQSIQIADEKRRELRFGVSKPIESGAWTLKENEFVWLNYSSKDGTVFNLTIFHFNSKFRMDYFMYAESAFHTGGDWILKKVIRTDIKNKTLKRQYYDKLKWDTDLTPKLLTLLGVKLDYLSLSELYDTAQYLESQGMDSTGHKLALWDILFQPITAVTFLFLSLAFVIGYSRGVSLGSQVLIGVVVGFSLRIIQNVLGQLALIYHWPPVFAVLIPSVFLLLLGVFIFSRGAR